MHYLIREVADKDLEFLASNLRGADAVELAATYGTPDFLGGLRRSVRASSVVKAIEGASGNAMFLFGYADWTPRSKLIWACGSPEITHPAYRTPFLRASREVIRDWFAGNPDTEYLINMAHSKNTVHLRWLEWCRAELLPEMPLGPLQQGFRPFIIRRAGYV